MGSQSKVNFSYIAGFLDGDGSIMLQIKKRKQGSKSGYRFMATICFYQDSRHNRPLFWIQRILKAGYLSHRKDGISELRINGYEVIEKNIENLLPFIKFKKLQAKKLLSSVKLLKKKNLTEKDLRLLVDNIVKIQKENYQSRKKRDKKELLKALGLTP